MISNRKIYLLMTATLEPRQDTPSLISFTYEERRKMYFRAFKYYVDKFRREGVRCGYDGVIFCDNSDADVSKFAQYVNGSENIEVISAPSEIFPAFLGKNNDFNIVDYVVDHSSLLVDRGVGFFKVTGRYYIENVADLLMDVRRCGDCVEYYCDIKNYGVPSIGGLVRHWDAEARYLFVTTSFWRDNFYNCYMKDPRCLPVERRIWDVAMNKKDDACCRFRFRREAYINGDQFTKNNAKVVHCWGVDISPDVYFSVRRIRWRLETVMRYLVPWFWF